MIASIRLGRNGYGKVVRALTEENEIIEGSYNTLDVKRGDLQKKEE